MLKPFGPCRRALIFDEEYEYEDYITSATKNIQADASDYASLNNRGVAYWEIGNVRAALDDFTAACALAPGESSPFLNRADILKESDDLEGALASATEAVRIAPTNYSCYFVRADIHERLGDVQNAEEDRRHGNRYRAEH